jgi:hypothetical protein
MKNLNKVLLTAMMVVVSTFALANDDKPNVKVERSGAKSFAVIAYDMGETPTQIQLKSQNGTALYTAVNTNGQHFAKRLDLNTLPSGHYSLEVENKESFTSTTIVIAKDSAFVNVADQVTIIKPIICQNGEKLDVILPSEADAVALITIYDNQNRKIASESLSGQPLKRFDLSLLEKGAYTLRVETKGKKFMQSVSIK